MKINKNLIKLLPITFQKAHIENKNNFEYEEKYNVNKNYHRLINKPISKMICFDNYEK